MQLELPFSKQPGILKVESSDLSPFGERTDFFFVPEGGDRMTAVTFLEPSEGVILVNGGGHITDFPLIPR